MHFFRCDLRFSAEALRFSAEALRFATVKLCVMFSSPNVDEDRRKHPQPSWREKEGEREREKREESREVRVGNKMRLSEAEGGSV